MLQNAQYFIKTSKMRVDYSVVNIYDDDLGLIPAANKKN